MEIPDGQLVQYKDEIPTITGTEKAIVAAISTQSQALVALANTLLPIAKFFEGQTMASMLQANAKSEATSAIVSAAIGKLGFDAQRHKTLATEIPHLIEAIFDKIEEKEKAKAAGVQFGPDVDAEEAFRQHEESVKKDS